MNGNVVSFALGANPAIVSRFRVGDTVRFDNSLYLALQTYYRHSIPERGSVWDFPPMFDSFRKADGSPKYPQREIVVGLRPGFGDEGVTPGAIHGKVIVLQSLMDGGRVAVGGRVVRTKGARRAGREVRRQFPDLVQRLCAARRADHTAGRESCRQLPGRAGPGAARPQRMGRTRRGAAGLHQLQGGPGAGGSSARRRDRARAFSPSST